MTSPRSDPQISPAARHNPGVPQQVGFAARALSDDGVPAPAVAPSGTIYTCPMHPQIRKLGPGSRPICGMTLEPLMPTEVEDDRELRAVRRRFWISAALALPAVVVAMLPHLVGLHISPVTAWSLRGAELLLSAPVVFWAAAGYYHRGWLGVRNGSPNMYTLILSVQLVVQRMEPTARLILRFGMERRL